MKLTKISARSFVGALGCAGLLGLLTMAMVFPVQKQNSSALSTGESTGTVQARANVQSVVSVAVDPVVELDITPDTEGKTVAKSAKLTVSTNNFSGYSVYVNSGEFNDLKNDNVAVTQSVAAIGGSNVALMAFGNNTWGYNVGKSPVSDGTLFNPVPLANVEIAPWENTEVSESGRDDLYLSFGAKVDTTLPAGSYSNTVTVSVVAKPIQITSLTQVTYMQDMTSGVCASTPGVDHPVGGNDANYYVTNPTTKQLIDSRDGNEYWVAKLADGHCWMTQNLALNIDATKGLSPATSDLNGSNAGWTATNLGVDTDGATKIAPSTTSATIPPADSNPSQTGTGSWNFSKNMGNSWVLATPTAAKSCGTSATNISDCTNVGFVDVSDTTKWQPTFQAQPGLWEGEEQDTVAVSLTTGNVADGGTYDPHYLIGNYYQWNTATAGSGGMITNKDARDSICPKGWKLPSSGSSADGTFGYMLEKYGVASNVTGTSPVDSKNYNIRFPSPLLCA